MQWSDLRNEITRSLKEPSSTDSGHWTFDELLRRANILMRTIVEQSECLKLIDTSNTSISGVSEYNKPAGCSRISRVAYGNTGIFGILPAELDMLTMNSGLTWQSLTGSVARYIDKPISIVLVPAPTDTGTVITIEYIAQPTEMINDTDIPFNAVNNLYSFHDMIVAGVVYRCLLEDKNSFYSEWKSIYEKGMERLKEFVRNMPDTMMTSSLMGGCRGKNIGPLPLYRGY